MTAQTEYILPKKAKGARPYFFEDPSLDKLLSMLMGLVGEVSVLADRVDTLERLLEKKGILEKDSIETYIADAVVREERDAQREELLRNVLRIIDQDHEDPDGGKPNDEAYLSALQKIAQ